MSHKIDVSDLPSPVVDAIESLVRIYREQARRQGITAGTAVRPIGWLKGKFEVPASFFEPLPDDLRDLFESGDVNRS